MHTKVLNPIPKAIGIRLSFLALLNLLSISRWAFDSSGSVVLNSADPYKQFLHAHYGLEKYFRWDGLYFAQIASNGYEREQELAFFPLWPLLMRWTGTLVWKLGRSTPAMDIQDVMLGGVILANIASVLAVIAFHKLTSLVIRNSVFAYIATIMYAMHPAPGISSVPYTEPFYALCTFGGSWLLLRQHEQNSEHRSISTMRRQTSIVTLDVLNRLRLDRIIGLLCLMLATGTRSLGILNCVSIGWPSLVRVYREKKWRLTTLVSLVLPAGKCLMVAFPSALFQYQAWVSLCRDKYQTPWCAKKIPLAYSYIQDHYWDVGFLRYWKVAQLPNFAIASPILVLSVYGLAKYGSHLCETPNQATLDRQRRLGHNDMAFWRNRGILPFFLIHLITTWLVLFASHTQIALRISIANPVIYWTAASLVSSSEADQAKWGRRWLRWTATWGCISIVLWSGFYPPA